MGKRKLGQLQPFELVICNNDRDVASIPMSDIGITNCKWNCANISTFGNAYINFYYKYEKL